MTIKNKYLLRNIDDLFDQLNRETMFSKIDFKFRYQQVCFIEEDIYNTNFRTRYGHYEFVVVPLGFTKAPVAFMCLMNSVLRPYMDNFVIVFIDDIWIYSKNEEEHVKYLVVVLRLLREHQFYAKIRK